jgi:formylmethanofuran dehydrogenase subunit C
MIAGSILLFGSPGQRTGAGMKRGTIAVFGPAAGRGELRLLPTFRLDCEFEPVFMRLVIGHLRSCSVPIECDLSACRFRRFSGDLVALGKGELLLWSP